MPSIGRTCVTDAVAQTPAPPPAPVGPAGDTAKGLRETEALPSKEEMKQMIREVVDDVIRSTISQVINQKVLATCPTCNCSDSSGSGCECKVLPSVTSLDKQAEEESKSTKSEDLLLLLKSPDVEVKHFLSSCKPAAPVACCQRNSHSQLKSRQILQVVADCKAAGADADADEAAPLNAGGPQSHRGNQAQEYGDDDGATSVQAGLSRHDQPSDQPAAGAGLQEEHAETGDGAADGERFEDEDEEDGEADEDAGDYESIRFDRQDLESKACLGFAHLQPDPCVDDDSSASQRPAPNDAVDQSERDIRSSAASHMPIKLNQFDLSKFISLVSLSASASVAAAAAAAAWPAADSSTKLNSRLRMDP